MTESVQDYEEEFEARQFSENSRLKLMNKTLRTENDFLRDELANIRRQLADLEGNLHRREFEEYDSRRGNFESLQQLETAYDRLERENSRLKHKLTSSKAPLVPLDSHPDEETHQLRAEVRKLRSVIDKMSRGASKSPSPAKQSPSKSGSKTTTLHEIYYDRSVENNELIHTESAK